MAVTICPECGKYIDHAVGIEFQQRIYWYTCSNCGLTWKEQSKVIMTVGMFKKGLNNTKTSSI